MTDSLTGGHAHGIGVKLEPQAHRILETGLRKLLDLTAGLAWKPLPTEKYPFPLTHVCYSRLPAPETVKDDVAARVHSDPVSVLENALALLELYECNQPGAAKHFLEDMPFIRTCFKSKRCNGWLAVMGDADAGALAEAINRRWQFELYTGRGGETGIYTLLNMLARYAFVYGRIPFGDAHALAHFVEDFCPGLLLCRGQLTDLQLTLSLAALKMGVPAVVPAAYPFPLGSTIRTDDAAQLLEAVVGFRNIRRLLHTPSLPPFPAYCDPANKTRKLTFVRTWGETAESFYLLRKGRVEQSGCEVSGAPGAALGILVTIDAEPLDAHDRRYIERQIIADFSMLRGVRCEYDGARLKIQLAEDAAPTPEQLAEVLAVTTRREFPKLRKIRVEIIGDAAALRALASQVRQEKEEREREIAGATEENAATFYQCVGCSPFAPDHVCVLTPERPPQCGRPYEMIKTGALYGYDDMSNIHHSWLHRDINSFRVIEKGACLDPDSGEWSGINENAARHTQGRTPRIFLHSLGAHPHTGCGCFRLIMFTTEQPRPGIGIMDAQYEGRAADGRNWRDLHYALAGKQTPGVAGAVPQYLLSPKFLKAHGGWKAVVWVSPKIVTFMQDQFPQGGIAIGE